MTDHMSTPMPDDMSLDAAVPSKSKYLSKEDCDPPILAQIAYMTKDQIEADNGMEERAVLNFHGDLKPLILNNTNKELLKIIFPGIQTTGQLKNQSIVLYNDPTIMFGKKMVGGIRIRSAVPQAPVAPPQYGTMAPPPVAPPSGTPFPNGDPNDNIPY